MKFIPIELLLVFFRNSSICFSWTCRNVRMHSECLLIYFVPFQSVFVSVKCHECSLQNFIVMHIVLFSIEATVCFPLKVYSVINSNHLSNE